MLAAIVNQVRDRADFQRVRAREFDEVRQARHRTVVVHDLAQNRGRGESGEPCQIATRLGMAGAGKDAAGMGDQGEYMTRLDDVFRAGVRRACHADGVRAIGRGNSRRDTLGGFDRYREIGAVKRSVYRRHRCEAELPSALLGDRHAYETSAELGHEIDNIRRDGVSRDDEVAFVFALLFIDQYRHPARLELGDDFRNRADGRRMLSRVRRSARSLDGVQFWRSHFWRSHFAAEQRAERARTTLYVLRSVASPGGFRNFTRCRRCPWSLRKARFAGRQTRSVH